MPVLAPISAAPTAFLTREPVPSTLGPWRLRGLLGAGESCEVYQASPLDAPPDSPACYAVKRLRESLSDNRLAIAQLQSEVFIAQLVSHPHVTSVLAAHVDRPPYYLVVPYQSGVALRDCLSPGGQMPLAQSLWFVRQVAEGLNALHDQQWVHRDVKPENVQISANGHATLCDLGLACPIGQNLVPATVLAGTIAYLPPEAFEDRPQFTPSFDTYSLGVMLFEMLTGRRPFESDDPSELVAAHRLVRAPDPRTLRSDIPMPVAHLLRRLLSKEPLRRPTGRELINWLVDAEIDCFESR